MNQPLPLTIDQLEQLAPLELRSYRTSRYFGDDNSVVMADFTPQSQQILHDVYGGLIQLLELFLQYNDRIIPPLVLKQFLETVRWNMLNDAIQHLEAASEPSPVIQMVMHDMRGGSFTALSIYIQLTLMGLVEANDVVRMFFLTRDHLKIMRNAIRDIDLNRYHADWMQKLHNVKLIVEKWSESEYKLPNSEAHIVVDCRFDGNISERCLEFSALDRVMYNLVNNAVRHTSDQHVFIAIFPLGHSEHPHDVRFVIINAITPEHQQLLTAKFGNDLNQLFAGGFTTGGTGLGMSICAQFVANAYGVASTDQALAEGYLGSALIEQHFVSWFHWPIAAD